MTYAEFRKEHKGQEIKAIGVVPGTYQKAVCSFPEESLIVDLFCGKGLPGKLSTTDFMYVLKTLEAMVNPSYTVDFRIRVTFPATFTLDKLESVVNDLFEHLDIPTFPIGEVLEYYGLTEHPLCLQCKQEYILLEEIPANDITPEHEGHGTRRRFRCPECEDDYEEVV